MTNAPGMRVSDPGRSEQPELVARRARRLRHHRRRSAWPATEVSVLASSSSTQENMKQKKQATPIPAAIVGMKILTKKRQKE